MTTFQAIVYGIVHGFAEFLPVSATAHRALVAYFVGWPEPSPAFVGALTLGTFLAALVTFRHDWASMISSVLQVAIYRKKPMTMDERMPLFITISVLPWAIARHSLASVFSFPTFPPELVLAAGLVAFSLPLALGESISRKNKGMYDWNILDSVVVGVCLIASLLPGSGAVTVIIGAALLRNFNREAAAKYAYFLSVPVLGLEAFHALHAAGLQRSAPAPDLSWLSFSMGVLLALFSGMLAIGALTKHVQRNGMGRFVLYRWLLAAATVGVYWWKGRSGF